MQIQTYFMELLVTLCGSILVWLSEHLQGAYMHAKWSTTAAGCDATSIEWPMHHPSADKCRTHTVREAADFEICSIRLTINFKNGSQLGPRRQHELDVVSTHSDRIHQKVPNAPVWGNGTHWGWRERFPPPLKWIIKGSLRSGVH